MGEELAREAGADVDIVVPVPMHWWRRLVQGHNGPDLAASFCLMA